MWLAVLFLLLLLYYSHLYYYYHHCSYKCYCYFYCHYNYYCYCYFYYITVTNYYYYQYSDCYDVRLCRRNGLDSKLLAVKQPRSSLCKMTLRDSSSLRRSRGGEVRNAMTALRLNLYIFSGMGTRPTGANERSSSQDAETPQELGEPGQRWAPCGPGPRALRPSPQVAQRSQKILSQQSPYNQDSQSSHAHQRMRPATLKPALESPRRMSSSILQPKFVSSLSKRGRGCQKCRCPPGPWRPAPRPSGWPAIVHDQRPPKCRVGLSGGQGGKGCIWGHDPHNGESKENHLEDEMEANV